MLEDQRINLMNMPVNVCGPLHEFRCETIIGNYIIRMMVIIIIIIMTATIFQCSGKGQQRMEVAGSASMLHNNPLSSERPVMNSMTRTPFPLLHISRRF